LKTEIKHAYIFGLYLR